MLSPYSDELRERVVDVSSTRQEEAAAGTEIVEEEELLILPGRRQKPLFKDTASEKLQYTAGRHPIITH